MNVFKSGLRLALIACPLMVSTARAADKVELVRDRDHINVVIGGKPFTTFFFPTDIAKPFFQPLRTPQGTIVTRDIITGNTFPPEHLNDPDLEPHQRPMYFGHGDIDGLDFWGEAVFPKYSDDSIFGREVFRKLEDMQSGPESGTLKADFDLTDPSGRVIADQIESFVFGGDQNARWIDCDFTVIANHGSDVVMGDTKEGSFAIRVASELDAPTGHMVNSAGAEGEKNIWGKPADWVNMDGTIAGEDLGIAVFDSPKSFRHPTTWMARGYGLLAANPFGWREFENDPSKDGSWTIQEGKSMTFRYRVFIHHGDYKQAKVAEAYRAYAAQEQR